MPTHYEVRYWSNGIRRCDLFLKEKQALGWKLQIEERTRAGRVTINFVMSSHSIEKEYRELHRKPEGRS